MIRITDERIFTMTSEDYHRLRMEYHQQMGHNFRLYPPSFEDWLYQYKGKQYTTHQQENP